MSDVMKELQRLGQEFDADKTTYKPQASDTQYTADELRQETLCIGTPYPNGSAHIASMLRAGADAMDALVKAEARVKELESWLVCAPIETPEDFHAMALTFVEDMYKARAALKVKP